MGCGSSSPVVVPKTLQFEMIKPFTLSKKQGIQETQGFQSSASVIIEKDTSPKMGPHQPPNPKPSVLSSRHLPKIGKTRERTNSLLPESLGSSENQNRIQVETSVAPINLNQSVRRQPSKLYKTALVPASSGLNLGHIVECDSVLECSMRGEEEHSRSRPRTIASKNINNSVLGRASMFMPQLAEEEQEESSDSGVREECNFPQLLMKVLGDENASSSKQRQIRQISIVPKNAICTSMAQIRSHKTIGKSSLTLLPSRDELSRGSQRRSLIILTKTEHSLFPKHFYSSESII
jgi:hypothetical protein